MDDELINKSTNGAAKPVNERERETDTRCRSSSVSEGRDNVSQSKLSSAGNLQESCAERLTSLTTYVSKGLEQSMAAWLLPHPGLGVYKRAGGDQSGIVALRVGHVLVVDRRQTAPIKPRMARALPPNSRRLCVHFGPASGLAIFGAAL